jgi:polysaccharide export outer membrane protein
MQDYPESPYTGDYTPPENYLIIANDNLHVRVTTPDPRLSAIFNATSDGGAMAVNEESTRLSSYTVQADGTVELPTIGPVAVGGKTLMEATETIEAVLADYVTDADVIVKLVNSSISILGDVRQPGLYPMYRDRLNIFEALSLAGDVSDFGDRYNVRIIRKSQEGSIVKEFDLTDKNIIDSEYYYIMPDDVIYVQPIKGKFLALNQFPYTVIFSSITAAISIIILIQNTAILNSQ